MKKFEVVETNLEFGDLTNREVTDGIVVHHTGMVDKDGTEIDRDVTAEEVHEWHLNNGWAGIGYHYVIRKDGTIERGRPEEAVGAHAEGHNWHTIGIHVSGTFNDHTPTKEQVESLARLVADICNRYELSIAVTCGHQYLCSTDCPGTNLNNLLPTIRGKAVWYQKNGLDA